MQLLYNLIETKEESYFAKDRMAACRFIRDLSLIYTCINIYINIHARTQTDEVQTC